MNITIQFLGILGAAIVGPLALAAVLAGIMVWLSKQVTAAPEPAPAATVRKAVMSHPQPQPRPRPEPGPQPEIEPFASEATSLEHEETHLRLVPAWLVLVYAAVIVWALVYVLMEVVPFFKPLTPQSAPAPAVAAPTATVAPTVSQPVASTGTGNAANGAKLFEANGCQACHSLKEGEKIIGPSLYHLRSVAASRIQGADYRGKAKTPEDYVHESILDPNLYVVPGFPSGVMVQDFSKKVNPQDLDDLVAFLMTQ